MTDTGSGRNTLVRMGFVHAALFIAMLAFGIVGWRYLMEIRLERIQISGNRMADPEEILDLVRVDTGEVLYRIDPSLIEDRVTRHPWIESAGVTRYPSGLMRLSIRERSPIVQILDPSGRPDFYLDVEGFQMPRSDSAAFNVPLLVGYPEKYHPVVPTKDEISRTFLRALAGSAPDITSLISEVAIEHDGVKLRLLPRATRPSVSVLLGKGSFVARLTLLRAFWKQRIIEQQTPDIKSIDLRYRSQVVAVSGS